MSTSPRPHRIPTAPTSPRRRTTKPSKKHLPTQSQSQFDDESSSLPKTTSGSQLDVPILNLSESALNTSITSNASSPTNATSASPHCIYTSLIYLLTNQPIYTLALSNVLPSSLLPSFSNVLLHASLQTKTAPSLVLSLIKHELYQHQHTPQTIFRSNSLASKFLGGYVSKVGKGWLKMVLGGLLSDLLDERDLSLEIDEARLKREHRELSKEALKEMARANAKQLERWTLRFLHRIMEKDMIDRMPSEVFLACKYISQISDSLRLDTPVMIGAFVMLRFINPGVATPEIFNLIDLKKKTPNGQRNLILISKILQNLANGVAFSGKKEPYMTVMNDFVQQRLGLMRHYFTSLVFRDGADSFSSTDNTDVYFPINAIRVSDFELDQIAQVHKWLYEFAVPLAENIFHQGLSELEPASTIMNNLLEFITLLEHLGAPLSEQDKEDLIAWHAQQSGEVALTTNTPLSAKDAKKSTIYTPTFDVSTGNRTAKVYQTTDTVFARVMTLFEEHVNSLDNSLFDDSFFFYRGVEFSAGTIDVHGKELPTYYLIARRVSSGLFSKLGGFIVHLLKTLRQNLWQPIRLVVDLQYFKFHESYTPLIHEFIDALAFFFPAGIWETLGANGQIIFLNLNNDDTAQQECKAAVHGVMSYLQTVTQMEHHAELYFIKSVEELRRHLGMTSSDHEEESQPLLPLLTLQPPHTTYEVQSVTVLGVKPREILLGPNSLLEIDPDTTIVKSEQRMITIDEVQIGNNDQMQVTIIFHPVIQSSTLFPDMDPHTSEKTYIFSSLQERDTFCNELFESAVAITASDHVLSHDFALADEKEQILKLTNSCLLLIEMKHRKIVEVLQLVKLQYARLDDQDARNVKLKFLDEDEERHIEFASPTSEESVSDYTPGERLLELLSQVLTQIQQVQDDSLR